MKSVHPEFGSGLFFPMKMDAASGGLAWSQADPVWSLTDLGAEEARCVRHKLTTLWSHTDLGVDGPLFGSPVLFGLRIAAVFDGFWGCSARVHRASTL